MSVISPIFICLEGGYLVYLIGQFGSVHAFDYNSTEIEPIWMKSGAL